MKNLLGALPSPADQHSSRAKEGSMLLVSHKILYMYFISNTPLALVYNICTQIWLILKYKITGTSIFKLAYKHISMCVLVKLLQTQNSVSLIIFLVKTENRWLYLTECNEGLPCLCL